MLRKYLELIASKNLQGILYLSVVFFYQLMKQKSQNKQNSVCFNQKECQR